MGSSDPANNMYAQLLPTALTSGVMSAGGLGIAQQLASALDPAIAASAASGGNTVDHWHERRQRRRGIKRADCGSGGVAPSSDDSVRCRLDRLGRRRRGHEHRSDLGHGSEGSRSENRRRRRPSEGAEGSS